MKCLLIGWLACLAASSALAQTPLQMSPLGRMAVIPVCHDYGCANETEVAFHEIQLQEVAAVLAGAETAAEERARLALVIGQLYVWAGRQSPVWRDRGGNYDDEGMPGSMDCIDHSTTTTRFLLLLAELGALRFHRVLEPQYRGRLFVHYSAVIEEIDADGVQHAEGADGSYLGQFVVDSWFGDNGTPALVLPVEEWREGGGPDV